MIFNPIHYAKTEYVSKKYDEIDEFNYQAKKNKNQFIENIENSIELARFI